MQANDQSERCAGNASLATPIMFQLIQSRSLLGGWRIRSTAWLAVHDMCQYHPVGGSGSFGSRYHQFK